MDILSIVNILTYLASAFVLFAIGKLIFRLFHPGLRIYHELLEKDNLAFSLSLIGYYIAIVIVIGGVIIGPSRGMLLDLIDIFTYGIMSIVLLNVSSRINDSLILNKFKVRKEIIDDQNPGTGVVEMALYIGTGLIIYGSVVGEGGGYHTALIFWAVAQVILWLAAKVYNLITPYDIHEHIEADNTAVGIGYAGAIIAISYLIMVGIEADFESWSSHFLTIGIDTGLGFILLPVMRIITDKLLLPGQNLTDEIVNQEKPNIGAAMIEAFAYISGAILIGWTL